MFRGQIIGDPNNLRALYAHARSGKDLAKDFYPSKHDKLFDLKDKNSRGRGI